MRHQQTIIDKDEIMKHNEQVMLYSREWLEHERRKAWQEGVTAGETGREKTRRNLRLH